MIVEKKFSWKYCMSLSTLNAGLALGMLYGFSMMIQPINLPVIWFIAVPLGFFTFMTLHMRYMWSYLVDEQPKLDEVK